MIEGLLDVASRGETYPTNPSLEQALFWRNIYAEIVAMEDALLDRVHQLMAGQSPQARLELELTDVPVVAEQAKRLRSRLGFWESRIGASQ